MPDAYDRAAEQLAEIADASGGTVQLHRAEQPNGGYGRFHISIRFDGIPRTDTGLRVRARESFVVVIPPTFPYRHPIVRTIHQRFAGFPHVQWRRQLCLFGSSADWHPEDGMYGFITRLDAWIRDAAINNLDPDDAPLHPPVAYPTVDRLVVPRADAPVVAGSPWVGFADLRERHHRTEIIGWRRLGGTLPSESALAVLLHKHLPFEYPETVRALLDEFESHGIEYAPFIFALAAYANHSPPGSPLLIVLGTPMRRPAAGGPHLQHLAVWQVSAGDADQLRHLAVSTDADSRTEKDNAITAVVTWSMTAKVGWCQVEEMRPEVTRRRDQSSPMAWFLGKRIAIWGCGAIGSRVAESVVRAGATHVDLADNKRVTPGILVRQGFEDADVGRLKVDALADRLQRIAPDLVTTVSSSDLIVHLQDPDSFPGVDLLIDCTASDALRTALEAVIGDTSSRPPIASVAIDATAATALATLSTPDHSGATLDLVRRLKLEACRSDNLTPFVDAFWPQTPGRKTFQPEPGCSEPTFIGSDADIAALSARMINAIAHALTTSAVTHPALGWLCPATGPIHAFSWPADHALSDRGRGYSVRVCAHALREMQAWARRSSRVAGPDIETGGLVFGEINEAAGVLWVSEVDGPPPDSTATADSFTCGVEGTAEAAEARHRRFRASVDCVGSWHTHPTSAPKLSDVDFAAAAQLLADSTAARRTCLLLILSGHPDTGAIGAYAFRTRSHDQKCLQFCETAAATTRIRRARQAKRNVGLALSGGGSRAIAFHLGCLRALHDLRLLERIEVLSSVSGGSVIAAMYAYTRDPFPIFDRKVVHLLRRGLHRDIAHETLRPANLLNALSDRLAAGWFTLTRFIAQVTRFALRLGPLPRHESRERQFTRTEAFRNVLKRDLFGNALVRDVARDSLATVINATELRTGSAFRFGSRESGCWRYGTIPPTDAYVVDAVAASAAYPAYLPTLDRRFLFTASDGTARRVRVLLTDGGVFENLGTGPMEPDRSSSFSTNVFKPNYVVCCDAGTGLLDDQHYPAYMPTRLHRTFLTVFRKVQDATRKRLHWFAESGAVSGFALAYLGQQDAALPWFPAGLPVRDDVRDYPTDFAPMADLDIDRLALRGELLTRFLVSYYLPEL